MLINEVIQSLTESYYEDLMVAIQDILTNLPEEQDSIPTEELRYRLSELGFDESIERLIRAVEESGFALSGDSLGQHSLSCTRLTV